MKNIYCIVVVLLTYFPLACSASPSRLIVDKMLKPRASVGHIEAVHKEIENTSGRLKFARIAILNGMLRVKSKAWLLEEEGPGFIVARFDYRAKTILMKIEYSEELIQLKYLDSGNGYGCENLVVDICYENDRGYYNYTKNLRRSIVDHL